jgi:hypothetical protein
VVTVPANSRRLGNSTNEAVAAQLARKEVVFNGTKWSDIQAEIRIGHYWELITTMEIMGIYAGEGMSRLSKLLERDLSDNSAQVVDVHANTILKTRRRSQQHR